MSFTQTPSRVLTRPPACPPRGPHPLQTPSPVSQTSSFLTRPLSFTALLGGPAFREPPQRDRSLGVSGRPCPCHSLAVALRNPWHPHGFFHLWPPHTIFPEATSSVDFSSKQIHRQTDKMVRPGNQKKQTPEIESSKKSRLFLCSQQTRPWHTGPGGSLGLALAPRCYPEEWPGPKDKGWACRASQGDVPVSGQFHSRDGGRRNIG